MNVVYDSHRMGVAFSYYHNSCCTTMISLNHILLDFLFRISFLIVLLVQDTIISFDDCLVQDTVIYAWVSSADSPQLT